MGPGAEKLQNVGRYEDEEAAGDGDLDEANSSHVQLCTTGNYWDGFPHDTSHITRCLRSGHGKKQLSGEIPVTTLGREQTTVSQQHLSCCSSTNTRQGWTHLQSEGNLARIKNPC